MIRTLEGLSGITHKSFIDQKTVTKDNERLFLANEGKTGYTMTTKEVPVITKNDMLFISDSPGPSMVFRAGSSPIWNRGQMTLPMSWQLIKENPIRVPGKTFNLQTVPSTSSVLDFDVKNNQPDFMKLLDEELQLAWEVGQVKEVYLDKTGLSEADVARLDKDVYSQDIMRMLNQRLAGKKADTQAMAEEMYDEEGMYSDDMIYSSGVSDALENEDLAETMVEEKAAMDDANEMRYAGGTLSRSMLANPTGELKRIIIEAYAGTVQYFEKDRQFKVKAGSLWSYDERVEYIRYDMEFYQNLKDKARERKSRVYDGIRSKGPLSREEELFGAYTVQDGFFQYLASLENWDDIARNYFQGKVTKLMQESLS